jgi:hypothetical protein
MAVMLVRKKWWYCPLDLDAAACGVRSLNSLVHMMSSPVPRLGATVLQRSLEESTEAQVIPEIPCA